MSRSVARPWGRALLWLAVLGPFFFLSYGFANQQAAVRAAAGMVGNIAMAWERAIPFWPWSIVPYWSIDVFYAVSPFVCKTRAELDRHGLRLASAQLIAVSCFLLWPLAFSFQRPASDGVFGLLFAALEGFDKPYNQAPSLHIVLLIVLWVLYARHLSGVWRVFLHVWFVLIGISVLTTWQHHFLDVPTGLAVGWLCVWLWPDAPQPSPLKREPLPLAHKRYRLAACYALGALALGGLMGMMGRAGWWLGWPALALALVAFNYAWAGAAGFQKGQDGRLSWAVRWLMAPYLVSAWANSRWWTRKAAQPVEVAPGIWLGRMPGRGERESFAAVVDVCAELPRVDARPADISLPMLDLLPPTPAQLRQAADAVEAARRHGTVLVCCALGYSRSAAAVVAWRVCHLGESSRTALTALHASKPDCVLSAAHRQALEALS